MVLSPLLCLPWTLFPSLERSKISRMETMYSDGSGIENTVKHSTTMLRSVLQYAKRAGMVDRNVASNRESYVDFPNPQRHEFQVLTPEEAQKMLECLEHEE